MRFNKTQFASDIFKTRMKEKKTRSSLRDVAKLTGVSHTQISRIESGANPEIDTFLRLCKWMNKVPEYYFVN